MNQSTTSDIFGTQVPKVPVLNPVAMRPTQDIHSFACGKCILVGEHAVVYGAHGIAVPLRNTSLNIKLSRSSNRDEFPQFSEGSSAEKLQKLLNRAREILGIDHKNYFHLAIDGSIPLGAGLGSSAALCVALLKALHFWLNYQRSSPLSTRIISDEPDSLLLANAANDLEKIFHGNPSGLDSFVVAHAESVYFQKNSPPKIIVLPQHADEKFSFVLIDSLERSATLDMVAKAKKFFTAPQSDRLIREFDELSQQTLEALVSRDPYMLGECLNRCGELLRSIDVSSPSLDAIDVFARSIGCIGSKLTGAGGGGMALVQLHPDNRAQQRSQIIQKFGPSRILEFEI